MHKFNKTCVHSQNHSYLNSLWPLFPAENPVLVYGGQTVPTQHPSPWRPEEINGFIYRSHTVSTPAMVKCSFYSRLCSCAVNCWDKKINNHQDLSGVCVQDVRYVLPTLCAQGAAAHHTDLPIRPTHLVTHPADFPITPTQPHTLVTVIRSISSLRLTDVHIMYNCWGYPSCRTAVKLQDEIN